MPPTAEELEELTEKYMAAAQSMALQTFAHSQISVAMDSHTSAFCGSGAHRRFCRVLGAAGVCDGGGVERKL